MIRLAGVRLRAPGRSAGPALLDGIDLELRGGERVALLGPNGAGKSLLLQVISGLRPPDEGVVEAWPAEAVAPRASLVFQTPDDQIVGSTVERDLAFPLENRAMPPDEMRPRVDAALERAGLTARRRDPPHLLSEGEKQRLALASALLMEPTLLLLDEPTSRLDPSARAAFLAEVDRAVRDDGVTVVMATHRSEEILPGDRVLALLSGRLAFDGTPAELLRSPRADEFSIRWSPLHRLRRELDDRGLAVGEERGERWNDPAALLDRILPEVSS